VPDQSNRTVLLVEDSAADREVVRRLLRQRTRTYTILEAATGAEGLAMCRDTHVDCVILDYFLSDMVGLQFLDALAAPTGESALVEMRRSPDVVVLDLTMPVLDGFGVLATMRADPVLSSVPVVVLTAKSLTEAERQFLSRSAVRVLQKGEYRLADVAALVLRAASGARAGNGMPAPRTESLEPA
jgi:CheY-like chemotaxis protein